MGDIFFEDHYIKVGNVNTRYWLAGEMGSTVILLHGLNCHVDTWDNFSGGRQKIYCGCISECMWENESCNADLFASWMESRNRR